MKDYKRKSRPVKAIQFLRQNMDKCLDFADGGIKNVTIPRSIDGIMTAQISRGPEKIKMIVISEGDYLVKDEDGFLYAVNNSYFKHYYEMINHEA